MAKEKCLLSALILGLFLCFFGSSSLALASELPPGVIVGDDSGIQVDQDGKYFIEHNDIKPGISFEKKITISNYSQEEDPFDLRMDMKGDTVTGEVNLLEAITVTLTLEGKEIYQGNLAGKSASPKQTLPLYLGKYKTGQTRTMDATFKVSSDIPMEQWKQKSTADFYWIFYATKEDQAKPKPKPEPKPKPKPEPKPSFLPKTGEDWAFVLMGVTIGVFIVMISLIVAKKRREREL